MELTLDNIIELVKKSQNGDKDALGKLCKASESTLYYNCYKIVQNEAVARDLTQDTFVDILTKIDTLQEPKQFMRWAKFIAINNCKDYLRKKSTKSEIFLTDMRGIDDDGEEESDAALYEKYSSLDSQETPEAVLDTEETRKAMLELIDELPDNQRACIVMRFYDGFSDAEIAEALGANYNTVRTWMSRALKKLSVSVQNYEKNGKKLYASTGTLLLAYIRYFLLAEEAAIAPAVYVGLSTGAVATVAAASAGAAASTTAATVTGEAIASATASAAAGAAVGATGVSSFGATFGAFIGTVTGKIVIGVIGAAIATGAFFGISHLSNTASATEPDSSIVEEISENTEVSSETHEAQAEESSSASTKNDNKTSSSSPNSSSSHSTDVSSSSETIQESSSVVESSSSKVPSESSVTESSSEQPSESSSEHQHQYAEKERKEATCGEDGYIVYECAECGDSYTETVGATGNHQYEVTEHTDATCVLTGKNVYVCSVCGDSYEETIPIDSTAHSYTETDYVAATCVAEGSRTYTCEDCGDVYVETLDIDPNGHVWAILLKGYDYVWVDDEMTRKASVCSLCHKQFYRDTLEETPYWINP